MPRFKLTIEYAGTRYSGWQIQKNARTVQGEIDRAVRTVTAARTSSCTDPGAPMPASMRSAQVAHLDVSTTLPPDTLRRRINDELPADINILAASQVPHRFHARHHAVARRYLYQIARRRTAFAKAYVWWVKEPLDVGRMREAARAFVGMRDFRSFAASRLARRGRAAAVDARARRSPRDHRGRRSAAGRHRGLALPVEDGAADGRRAGRDRTRRRCRPTPIRTILAEGSSAPARLDGAPLRAVSRKVYYEGDAQDVAPRAATPL